MKKVNKVVIFSSILFFTITISIFAQDVEIKKWADASARVKGYTPEPCWLGVTAIIDGREIDLKPKRVSGNFSTFFALPLKESINAVISEVTWIACLWEEKVEQCGCEYCRTQGYHLEGRLARDTDS